MRQRMRLCVMVDTSTKAKPKAKAKAKPPSKPASAPKKSKAHVASGSNVNVVRERGRKKQREKQRRMMLYGTIGMTTLMVGLGVAFGVHQDIVDWGHRQWVRVTYDAGYEFKELVVEGRKVTPADAIVSAVGMASGDPLFLYSLDHIRQQLEKIPTVRQAHVGRDLSGTITVNLIERQPYVLWQHEGLVRVIDEDGVVLEGERPEDYPHMITVVGSEAPQHMHELVQLFKEDKELARRIVASVLVSDRRWDIHFDTGIHVKLPEEKPIGAWKKMIELQKTENILSKPIKEIDMRDPNAQYLSLPDDLEAVERDEPDGDV
ncbi:MAG: FtsQ-type POTRA domain-containing protein [Alphaproteobacteria bacterium]|nr:MAG: FtsQ-type POTRA domain-containing protein [Alphaproteobacteria bacterium]